METYFYKCNECGFVHFVPAYWVSFNPEEEMEFTHVRPDTQQDCINIKLHLMKEQ